MERVYELWTTVETRSTMNRCPWKATELDLWGLLSSRAPAKGGRRGRGICCGLQRRVSSGEAAGRHGDMVVVGELGGGAL
jgi:hypothetical protein